MRLFTALLLAATLGSGCTYRYIVDASDPEVPADGRAASLVTTYDVQSFLFFGIAKTVFWECTDTGGALECKKTCDIKDPETGDRVLCPKAGVGVY